MSAFLRLGALAMGALVLSTPALSQEPAALRVKVFPGAQNLALFTGLAKGTFLKHGVKVDLQFTQNSTELRNGLAEGAFDVAHAAVDNGVAMVELAKKDMVIVMGGDSSMNELFVQPDIAGPADMRGRTLIVDAPNTAYALQAKKILLKAGLRPEVDYKVKVAGGTFQRVKAMIADAENAASTLNPPFSFEAAKAGKRSLGRVIDLIGPYQASGGFVMREWAKANASLLERYIAGYVEALRYALDPAHRDESVALLGERLKLTPELAEATYQALVAPGFGLTPDARLDLEGFKAVLALREEIEGQWGGTPPAPDRYLDLSYYERALARLGR